MQVSLQPSLSNPSVSVLVVEDDLLLRGMLEEFVSRVSGLKCLQGCGTLTDARAFLRSSASPPDCIILDVVLPDGKGWELLSEKPIVAGKTKVFFATGKTDDYTLLFFIRRKISGFIHKASSQLADWVVALECIAAGRGYCSSFLVTEVSKILMDSTHWSKLLTNKEFAVLPFMVEGKSNQEIGDLLISAPSTIAGHRKNIMRKIRVHSTPELMSWARRTGVSS